MDFSIDRRTLTRIAIAASIVLAVVLLRALPVGDWLTGAETWIQANPLVGALVYLGLSVIAVVALTPGWIPMMLGGVLFGFTAGLTYGLLAITIGATAALLTGRTLARGWVEHRIAGNEQLMALDDALEEQAFTIVALTRLALVIPFNMLNYAYGLTRVDLPTYAVATAVGMLPIVALYAYLGTLAGDIGRVLAGEAPAGPGAWWIAGIAAVAVSAVVLVVRRAVRRALNRRTGTGVEE